MSLFDEYLCGAVDLELLRRDARDKVRWAAVPVEPGEKVKAQILRAFKELRTLDYGLVRATWHEQCGPYQYPHVHNAWLSLAKRRAAAFEQFATLEQQAQAPFLAYVNELPIEPVTRAQADVLRTRLRRRTG